MTGLRDGESAPDDPRWRPLVAEAVRDSLSALEQVLVSSEDRVALAGPDRRFASANPAACRLLGRPLDQLRGRDFLASLPASSHEATGALPEPLDQAGRPFTCVVRDPEGAEREGAELTVTSAPGAGATVTLLLPHHLEEAARHAQ